MAEPQRERELTADFEDIFHVPGVILIAHTTQRRRNQPLRGIHLAEEEAGPRVPLLRGISGAEVGRGERVEDEAPAQSAVDRSGEIVILEEPDIDAELQLVAAFDPGNIVDISVVAVLGRIVRLLVGIAESQASIRVVDIEHRKPGRIRSHAGQFVGLVAVPAVSLADRVAGCVSEPEVVQKIRANRLIVIGTQGIPGHGIVAPKSDGRRRP